MNLNGIYKMGSLNLLNFSKIGLWSEVNIGRLMTVAFGKEETQFGKAIA